MTESSPAYTALPPLRLGERPPFWMPLIVEHCDDHAAPAAMRFDLQVLDVGRRTWRAMMAEIDTLMADAEISEEQKEDRAAVILRRVVVGWRHVQDDNQQPLAFTPERFGMLLNIQGMALAIVQGYGASCPQASPGVNPEA